MVPGFVAGQYALEELTLDVVALAGRAGATVVLHAATGIDPVARRLRVEGADDLDYDVTSFDVGSTVRGLHVPGVREYAVPTRPIGDFVRLVDRAVTKALEHATAGLRVVIVGGGSAGVELAFTLEHRLRTDGGGARVGASSIRVLEAGPRVLSGYTPRLARRVLQRAGRRGIRVETSATVTSVSPDRVHRVDGSSDPADLVLWVTGASSHDLFEDSGLTTDADGFLSVGSTLQAIGHPEIFAVGDCAHLIDFPETPKAGVYAVRQGPVLDRNLRAFIEGRALESYRPQSDFLALLNLGDGWAIGTKWDRVVEGRWVMRLKDRIDRRWMERYQT